MGVPFPANVNRFDPYKNYAFRVYFGDSATPVAGVNKVGELKQTTDAIAYNEGGNGVTRQGPGRTKYAAVVLERGVTHDPEFENWASASQVLDKGVPSQSLKNLRKQVRIELLNEAGQPVLRYILHRCFVTEFSMLPSLDAGGNAIAIEKITITHEGVERDKTLSMPTER